VEQGVAQPQARPGSGGVRGHSNRVRENSTTRSPGPTPETINPAARAVTCSAASPYVTGTQVPPARRRKPTCPGGFAACRYTSSKTASDDPAAERGGTLYPRLWHLPDVGTAPLRGWHHLPGAPRPDSPDVGGVQRVADVGHDPDWSAGLRAPHRAPHRASRSCAHTVLPCR